VSLSVCVLGGGRMCVSMRVCESVFRGGRGCVRVCVCVCVCAYITFVNY
jgi:hypothetical protein